jgi:homocysteine S-methyltransferase
LETTLIFHYGIELRYFAAFELLTHKEGRTTLKKHIQPYLNLARKYQLNFVLDTPTWRANSDWGIKLGYSERELQQINHDAVAFALEQKHALSEDSTHIVLCGEIGPRGDGYVTENLMTPE